MMKLVSKCLLVAIVLLGTLYGPTELTRVILGTLFSPTETITIITTVRSPGIWIGAGEITLMWVGYFTAVVALFALAVWE